MFCCCYYLFLLLILVVLRHALIGETAAEMEGGGDVYFWRMSVTLRFQKIQACHASEIIEKAGHVKLAIFGDSASLCA